VGWLVFIIIVVAVVAVYFHSQKVRGVGAWLRVERRSPPPPGLETFVFSEILRQSEWFPETAGLYHFRDKDQNEVDVVVEDLAGRIVGIEVNASATVRGEDFRGLKRLALASGEDFRLGVILYDGDRVFPFGEGLFAAPVSTLWD